MTLERSITEILSLGISGHGDTEGKSGEGLWEWHDLMLSKILACVCLQLPTKTGKQRAMSKFSLLREVEIGMKKPPVPNVHKKVYVKPASGHQHKWSPDVRRIQPLSVPHPHFTARTPRHSTCTCMVSCLHAGQMAWAHTFWSWEYADVRSWVWRTKIGFV